MALRATIGEAGGAVDRGIDGARTSGNRGDGIAFPDRWTLALCVSSPIAHLIQSKRETAKALGSCCKTRQDGLYWLIVGPDNVGSLNHYAALPRVVTKERLRMDVRSVSAPKSRLTSVSEIQISTRLMPWLTSMI